MRLWLADLDGGMCELTIANVCDVGGGGGPQVEDDHPGTWFISSFLRSPFYFDMYNMNMYETIFTSYLIYKVYLS